MTSPASAITRHGDALTNLARLLQEASVWEFAAPPRRTPAPGEARPSGRIADPTANVATDERRLALRAALVDAAASITSASVFLESASESLELALAPYGAEPLVDLADAPLAA